MSGNKLKHVSFDLDGTLIDSIPAMKSAWESTMKEVGLTTPFVKYAKYVGLPFNVILERLELLEFSNEITDFYFDQSRKNHHQVHLIHGAKELLESLSSTGISTSIITSKPRTNAEFFCKNLKIETDFLLCGDDFYQGKPKIEPGKQLVAKLKINSDEVIYVGDMIFDLQFAANCGFDFVYFKNDNRNKLPRYLLNNVKSINKLSELHDYLN
jgi:HAD superfamily hydrolase (TIGR01549 family)